MCQWRVCALFALVQEAESFNAAASLDTHKALVHIFFAQRSTKKVRGEKQLGRSRQERQLARAEGFVLQCSALSKALLVSLPGRGTAPAGVPPNSGGTDLPCILLPSCCWRSPVPVRTQRRQCIVIVVILL